MDQVNELYLAQRYFRIRDFDSCITICSRILEKTFNDQVSSPPPFTKHLHLPQLLGGDSKT